MIEIRADLHIHTCLSPCGDLDMTPKKIISKARELGLDIIAITDHNSCGNVGATQRLGDHWGVKVLPGMEITTKEEVHILGIFGDLEAAKVLETRIVETIQVQNRPELFGYQVLVNEEEEVEGFVAPLLISATGFSVEEVVGAIHELGGICVASHVEKPAFSLLSQLGLVPRDLGLDALEVADLGLFEGYRQSGLVPDLPLLFSSDAHFLDEIGKRYTRFLVDSPEFGELRMAIRSEAGRKVVLLQ
jgi:predicted metal-dependent phosphoesterase TrpH